MDTFRNLVSRHLLHKQAMPSPPSTRWRHSICKALTRAASSIAAAVGHFFDDDDEASSEDDDDGVEPYCLERTLPPNHPHNVRVRRMAANLIAAACDDETYAGRRRPPLARIQRPFHGVDWRVEVLDADYVNAFSFANGGIFVSTGFITYMEKDAHIATVLGHEIGHVIARHIWEGFRNSYWVGVLVNMAADLLELPRDRLAQDKWESIFMRPCRFRQEYEADHLGLLLLAAAGYDPRIAPSMYTELAELEERYRSVQSTDDDDHLSTHPPSMKRAQRLSQAKVMDEALDLYRQAVRSGKRTEALDSWSSTLTLGLSWGLFWADKWLQGASNHWNSVRDSVRLRPPERHNRARMNLSPNCRIVAQAAVPANRRCSKGIIGQSLSSGQQDMYQTAGTGYASGLQLQQNHDDPPAYNTGGFFPCAKLLWESGAPPKVKFFMWQLMHGMLWSSADPSSHPGHDRQCLFCAQDLDESASHDHIAFNCCFAKEIWRNVLSWAVVPIVLPPVVPSVDVWWKHLRSSVAKDGRRALDTLLVATIWHLCLEQNARRLCTKEKSTTTKLTLKIQQETFAWLGACAKHL